MTLGNAVYRRRKRLDVGVRGPQVGEAFFRGVSAHYGLPSTHLSLSQSMSMVVLVSPASPPHLPQHMPFPSCSGVVLSERGNSGRFWICASYAIRLQHLESWTGSTWERVPEKTNFRSWLIWEKAHVHGGSFRDLGKGLGGLGPCL